MVTNWLATAEVTGIRATEAREEEEKTNLDGRRVAISGRDAKADLRPE